MNTFPSSNSLSVSVRIYRAMLVAYPKKFREHYETQMLQVFRDSFREAYRHHAVFGVIDLWLHTFVDLVFTALMERILERSQYMFSPKVVLWGGIAGAFGGLFWLMSGLAPSSGGLGLALALGLGGLVSLYAQQSGQGGKLGLAGFALGIIGTVLALATLWWFDRTLPSTIKTEPALFAPPILILLLAFVILGVGLAMLGVAGLLAKTLHRWRGLSLGVGLLSVLNGMTTWLVYYVPMSEGRDPWATWPPQGYVLTVTTLVLLGLGWIALGAMLATEGDSQIPVAQPPPNSA